jgi:hypothetical protein
MIKGLCQKKKDWAEERIKDNIERYGGVLAGEND